MTLILILAVIAVVGVSIRSRWTLLLPASIGLLATGALKLTGQSLSDTPIPFLALAGTLVIAAARLARTRLLSPTA